MKKLLFFAFFFSCLLYTLSAQQPGDNRRALVQERIEAQRIAFITNKLKLTPEESQSFWPLFNQYKEDNKALQNSLIKPADINTASDAEVEQYLMGSLDIEEKQISLKRAYIQKLKDILPIRKVAKLMGIERQFNRYILNQVSNRNNRK